MGLAPRFLCNGGADHVCVRRVARVATVISFDRYKEDTLYVCLSTCQYTRVATIIAIEYTCIKKTDTTDGNSNEPVAAGGGAGGGALDPAPVCVANEVPATPRTLTHASIPLPSPSSSHNPHSLTHASHRHSHPTPLSRARANAG